MSSSLGLKCTLFQLKCSIFLGGEYNQCIIYSILVYLFLKKMAKLCTFANLIMQKLVETYLNFFANFFIYSNILTSLKKAWPKQVLWKLFSKPKFSQSITHIDPTIELNSLPKLDFLFLLHVSNKLMVICFGY